MMCNYLTDAKSSVQEWWIELQESENWNYYVNDRAVFHGFPVAVISSLAAATIFNFPPLSAGATFGAVNYIALTSLLESIRAKHHIDTMTATFILAIGSAVSVGVVQTVYNTQMSYPAMAILSIAAFAGQLFREYYMTDGS